MLDGTKVMRRMIPIEIQGDPSGVNDYRVSRRLDRFTVKKVAVHVSEDQIEALLTEREYQRFQEGAFRFKVSAGTLCETFQYLA